MRWSALAFIARLNGRLSLDLCRRQMSLAPCAAAGRQDPRYCRSLPSDSSMNEVDRRMNTHASTVTLPCSDGWTGESLRRSAQFARRSASGARNEGSKIASAFGLALNV